MTLNPSSFYSAATFNIAVRITGNKMDAEDILQESFIIAFDRLDEMDNPSSFGNWLKRIVINNSISFIRKRKIIFEDLHEKITGPEDPSGEIDMSIDPAVVHNAIKELPDGSRKIDVKVTLSEIDRELGNRETEFRSLVNLKTEEVKAFSNADNQVIKELFEEVRNLDVFYDQAMKDLKEMGYNEKIVNTIFDTYEKKIRLLELVIFESNKAGSYENNGKINL